MKNRLRHIVLFFSLLAFSVDSFATHIVGGDITVRYLSPNTFEVTVTFFRDCNALTDFEPTIYVGVYDKITNATQQVIAMPLISRNILALGDPCYTPPSLCVEKGVFQATVNIPDNPNGYYLSYHRCCRNGIINNIVSPGGAGFVFYCEIANPALHSSTPVFNTIPDAYMCQNFPNADDFSATDADGDQLVYSFTDPLDCSATGICSNNAIIPIGVYGGSDPWAWPGPYGAITWQPPYNLSNILGDPAMAVSSTGTVSCTPPNLGVFVFCVRVEEYRGGIKIGEIRRDFQFQVLACTVFNVSVPGTNPICKGETTTLVANGGPPGSSYVWNTGQTTSSITATPTATGTYTFSVTASNGTCVVTSSATVAVNPVPTPSIITTGNVCLGQNTTLAASGGGTYSWNTGSVSNILTGVANGTYTVFVTNGFGCTASFPGTVNQAAVLTSSVTLAYVPCSGTLASATVNQAGGAAAYSYLWSNTQATQTATGLNNGNYTVTVTDGNGCTSVSTQSVTIYPPVVAAYSVTTVCLGNPTQFTDQSSATITSWSWNFGDAATSTQQSPSHTYTTSGTFTATLISTGPGGCNSTVSHVVTVNPQPVANFSVTTVCFGNPTQFTDQSTGGGTQWNWNFGDGNTSTQQSPANTYTAPGTYTATLITTGPAGGCNSTVSKTVTIFPQPVASFSATTVCLGNPTQFTDQTTGGGTIWSWTFGDGNTSAQQNPSNTYTASGTYTVTMNASAVGGCNSNFSVPVIVNPQPVANFSVTTVCFGLPTQFTDLSTGGGTQWSWNFGDGNTSILQSPSNTYTAAGTYTATLTSTGPGGCNSVIAHQVTVFSLSVANFTVADICLNTNPAQFVDQSTGAVLWTWNFGDGTATSGQTNPTHVYGAPGTYTVSLIVQSGGTCIDSIKHVINVNPVPDANFISTIVCFNNPTQFTDQSLGVPNQWSWDFGDGNTGTGATPTHTYGASGTYTVILIATNSLGCSDTLPLTAIVNPNPVANFSAPTVCVGNASCFTDLTTISQGVISGWSWNFNDPSSGANNISNMQNPCHLFTAVGIYNVILTVTSGMGCQTTINLPISVTVPPVAAFTSNSVCLNSPTSFTDLSTGAIGWNWNFGDGGTSTTQNPSHVYLGYGTYVVTLIASAGGICTDTATDTITVNPVPIVNFNADSVCVGRPSTFTDASFMPAGNIVAWGWNFGDPVSGINNTSNLQNPTHVFSTAGTYSVTLTVTSAAGCVSSKVFSVIVFPGPDADFSFSPGSPVNLTDAITFTDQTTGSPVQWWWDFGDNDTSILQNPDHHYPDIGTYTITLIAVNQNGCPDTIRKPLEILQYAFFIPNAFTPGTDGKNDFFFGKGVGIVEYELYIFDRWGNLIFYCNIKDLPQSPPCMWDGKVEAGTSNEQVQQDVYVWKVKLLDVFGDSHKYIGTVTVVK
jgi:gliding motility-associated-like protein